MCDQDKLGNVCAYTDLIVDAAGNYNIDPSLIAAVIYEESRGDSQAISSSGAVGLMQIMPSDGIAASFQCPNGPCFANRPKTNELLDPVYNINYGSNYLKGLISKYGSVREALLHYGPINVGYSYADLVLETLSLIQQ